MAKKAVTLGKRPVAKTTSKKAVSKKAAPKRQAAKKAAPRTPAVQTSPKDKPKATQSPWTGGFEAWRAVTRRSTEIYLEAGRSTSVATIELSRRNVEFHSRLVQAGLQAVKSVQH